MIARLHTLLPALLPVLLLGACTLTRPTIESGRILKPGADEIGLLLYVSATRNSQAAFAPRLMGVPRDTTDEPGIISFFRWFDLGAFFFFRTGLGHQLDWEFQVDPTRTFRLFGRGYHLHAAVGLRGAIADDADVGAALWGSRLIINYLAAERLRGQRIHNLLLELEGRLTGSLDADTTEPVASVYGRWRWFGYTSSGFSPDEIATYPHFGSGSRSGFELGGYLGAFITERDGESDDDGGKRYALQAGASLVEPLRLQAVDPAWQVVPRISASMLLIPPKQPPKSR